MMLLMVQGMAYAEKEMDQDMEPAQKYEQIKGRLLEQIEKRRGLLDSFEGCVKAAKSKEDLQSCRQDHKAQLDELRGENKEMRGKMKENRQERMESRKDRRKKSDE